MPIFEYTCLKCGSDFEKLVKVDNETHIICPACGSPEVGKKLSSFATPRSTTGGSCAPGGG